MSFERGGRSDKQGNVYENRCLARVLIRLISEEIASVVVEPLGKVTEICEFYTVEKSGKKTYYQCKGSNSTNDHWTPSDLQRYHLFTRVKELLQKDPNCRFRFISPLYYNGLNDLCDRARTCSSADGFLKQTESNGQLRGTFHACEKYFSLDRSNSEELNTLINLLSRCEFLVRPNNSETIEDLDQFVNLYFWGKPGNTRVLLENFTNDTSSYGIEITTSTILNYLTEKGAKPRLLLGDSRTAPAIARLNESFLASFRAIRGSLFHRNSADELIREIEAGNSIILHGRAGSGKSGCIQELIDYLKVNQIDYLAIQLDKHVPDGFADKYGEALGLPGSPANSLFHMAGTKPCVLILDQLDALRWSALHSSVALDVCKELIAQVQTINKYASGHVSIVFVVRTFDYENDIGIQSLFSQQQEEWGKSWSVIQIGILSNDEVRQIVGDEYQWLPSRVKDLLRVPSSLYVWLLLDSVKRNNQIASAQDMVYQWWHQIQDNYSAAGYSRSSLTDCIEKMIYVISKSEHFSLPRSSFLRYTHELDFLVSGGMLISENNSVSFAHQSILDAFLLEQDLNAIYTSEHTILSLVLSWGAQVPITRYRLAALLQNVIDTNQNMFAIQAADFLESAQVHFYYKAAVFEAVGQVIKPIPAIYKLIDEYYNISEWRKVIFQTVYERHPVFIEHLLSQRCFDWLSEEGQTLLVTMRYTTPQKVASVLQELMTSNKATPKRIMSILGWTLGAESDELFDLRMEILRGNRELLSEMRFIDLERAQPSHIMSFFAFVLSDVGLLGPNHIYFDHNRHQQFCEENYIIILHSLLDSVCISANQTQLALHTTYDNDERLWHRRGTELSLARESVELVKESLKVLVDKKPENALEFIKQAGQYKNGVANEIALSAILQLPMEYSDFAIEWILTDFDYHILDCIGDERDYLSTCKKVLKKHSLHCSNILFEQLEYRICNWKGDRDYSVETIKWRVEYNRTKKHGPVYWPAWGHLQKDLLPILDPSRLKKSTKDLIAVLNRNQFVQTGKYHAGLLVEPARSVVSPVHRKVTQLSDRAWLKIIEGKHGKRFFEDHAKDGGDVYLQSSHWSFAQDFGLCVEQDPARYAKLFLKLPNNCFPGYYTSVLYGLTNQNALSVDPLLLFEAIRHAMRIPSDDISMAIIRVIKSRPAESWPADIVSYLISIAAGDLKLVDQKNDIALEEGESFPSPDSMITDVVNDLRGAAIVTIGRLSEHHHYIVEMVKPLIDILAKDEDSIVRYALVDCIAAFYEYDPIFAMNLLDKLLETDLFIICAHQTYGLMRTDLNVLETRFFPYLKKACEGQNPHLVLRAAQLICDTAILTASDNVLSFLYSFPWTVESRDKICQEAVYAFEFEKYRPICQEILEAFLKSNAAGLHSINFLFYDNRLDIKRDESFIKTILLERRDIDTTNAFLEFIKTQDTDISGFAEIIRIAVESIDENAASWQKYGIEDGIVQAVIKLIDTSKGDNERTECCLDILDKIYQKRILTDSAISKLLDGVE